MPTETDLRDRGDRKKRAAPVECTIEEASALSEWFCRSRLGNWDGAFLRFYRDGIKLKEYVGGGAFKQDMVSQMTDIAFQRAGIFPGLTFFNMVVDSEIREKQGKLNEARKLLPTPYDTEFTKPAMPSDIRPYSFFRTVSLYHQIIDSHPHLYYLPSISTAIRDLQPFYSAVASDSEINKKHGDFIKSLLDNIFSSNKLKIESVFVTHLIGLYKSAVARLGDQGIDLLDSVQRNIAASLINLTKVNNESMNSFLTRFKDYLSEQNELIEQLNIEQLR